MTRILILLALVALAGAAVTFATARASRSLAKRTPNSVLLVSITPTGIALSLCFVAVLVMGVAGRQLAPDSNLGSFLATWQGVIIGLGLAWLAFTIAATALHVLGQPIVRVKRHSGA